MSAHTPEQMQAIEVALMEAYVFNKAAPEEVIALVEVAEWVSLPPQALVVKEGAPSNSLFVLARGKLVVKEFVSGTAELVIARITPGDVVGELGFVDQQVASASVRSDGPADLVRLGYAELNAAFERHPGLELKFFRELIRTLAERVRKSNQILRSSIMSSAVSRC
jgi:CRP/FNR family cyclic AMP-dependent transcriptional regulator